MTNKDKILNYLKSLSNADYPLDTIGIFKAINIPYNSPNRYLIARLHTQNIIKLDNIYKGWRMV